jgi:hypothetical protein
MSAGDPSGTATRAAVPADGAWHARAFGVDLELSFEAPALRRCMVPADAVRDPAKLVLVDDEVIEARWAGRKDNSLGGMANPDGTVLLEIFEDPELGILFEANVHGRYAIDPDRLRVLCAPADAEPWHWQRMLVGQVLPLLSALHGFQVLHASAVAIDGRRAVAVSGQPGTGKSTLALEFAIRGHDLLAEDVLALRIANGRALAEPGVALVNLRPSDDVERTLETAGLRVLGRSHKIHVDLPRASTLLPLEALYLLEPAGPGGGVIEPRPEPSLPELAQTSFVPYLERKEDLLRHLELSAVIARTVHVARVGVDRTEGVGPLADRLERHARELPVL